jgi:glycosyltransferase involved in cell wall biosynthesis
MGLRYDHNIESDKAEKTLAVVPVYNGQPSVIVKAISSLLSQGYPLLRIAVIDDCSEEALYNVLYKEFGQNPRITLLRNERNVGFSKTLNKSLDLVTDEKFLFVLEQDCELLDTDYISKGIRHFEQGQIGAVSGENLLPSTEQLSLMKRLFVNHLCEDVHDSNVVEVGFSLLKADIFRVDVLKKIGGFESSAKWKFASEEHIVSFKIRSSGYVIIKDPELRFLAYWGRQENLLQNLRKEGLYGRGLGLAIANNQANLELGESKQLKSKMITRIVQGQYVALTCFSILLLFFSPLLALLFIISSALLHLVYLAFRATNFSNPKEKILYIATGFLRSWIYIPNFFLGFLYGFLLQCKDRIEHVIGEGSDRF